MRQLRTDEEKRREMDYALSESKHHRDALKKRLMVCLSTAAVAELFGCTQANVRDATKKAQLRERWKLQGFGRVYAVWDVEIVFGGGPEDETFDSRMVRIDEMVDQNLALSIDGAMTYIAHTGPVLFKRENSDDE